MKGILAAQVQFTIQDWTHPLVSVQFTIHNWTRAIVAYLFWVRIPYASIIAVHFTIQNWTYQFFDSPIYNSELDPANRDGPIFDSELDPFCRGILFGLWILYATFPSVHFTIQNWTHQFCGGPFYDSELDRVG